MRTPLRDLDIARGASERADENPRGPLLVDRAPAARPAAPRSLVALAVFTAIAGGLFLAVPGDLTGKLHFALQGVCAQRPSHSLLFGGMPLPLDARMTGLYTGAAVAWLWLVACGRERAAAPFSRPVLATLAVFALSLVGDGFAALLFDLGLPHPYAPSNALRLATGILAGTSLGVTLASLFARSIWKEADQKRCLVPSVADLLPPLLISSALALLEASGVAALFAPIAVGLLLAVVGVFAVLGSILLALAAEGKGAARSWRDLGPLAGGSLAIALMLLAILAGFRLLAETALALPKLT